MTDEEVRTQLMVQTGTSDDVLVLDNIQAWWDFYDGQGQELQYWYTFRTIALYLMGKARRMVDVTVGRDRVWASQEFEHALELIKLANEQLTAINGTATLKTTQPKNRLEIDECNLSNALSRSY